MPAGKHLSYFRIEDALGAVECPICHLVEGDIEKFFADLMYQNVNDISFRAQFRADGGFCNYHAYQFAAYNDGLAIALTHRAILVDKTAALGEKRQGWFSALAPPKLPHCIVCELAHNAEVKYLATMGEYLADAEFKTRFLSSHGLCIPHYEMLAERVKSVPKWFKEFHTARYADILTKLDRYIASCNISLGAARPVLSGEEELIWREVIGILFGYKGK